MRHTPRTILKRLLSEVVSVTGWGQGLESDKVCSCGPIRSRVSDSACAVEGDNGSAGATDRGVRRALTAGSVLVVDDEPLILDLLQAVCEQWPVGVQRAAGRFEALKLMHAQRYDLVISDYFLGEDDGARLFSSARLIDPVYSKRFLFMSGSRDDVRVKRLTDRYRIPCLAKPFSFVELREAAFPILLRSLGEMESGPPSGRSPFYAECDGESSADG